MIIGLLLLRQLVGGVLVGHGVRKLSHRLGPGPQATGRYFDKLGYRPGQPLAVVTGLTETVGGTLLAMGLLTPLAAAMVVGVLINAARQELTRGFWAENGGCEYPVVLGVTSLALVSIGPGPASVDHAIDLDLAGPVWAACAVLLALVATLPVRLLTRPTPHHGAQR